MNLVLDTVSGSVGTCLSSVGYSGFGSVERPKINFKKLSH